MNQERIKFGRDILISGATTALKSLRNLLLLSVLTHGLSPDQYGAWETVGVAIALLSPWVSLQLGVAVIRFLSGLTAISELREGFYSVLFSALGLSLVLGTFVVALLWSQDQRPIVAPFTPYMSMLLVLLPVSVGNGISLNFLRAMRMIRHHSATILLQLFGELFLLWHALQSPTDIRQLLWMLVLARSASMSLSVLIAGKRIGFALPKFTNLRTYLAFAIPLVPNASVYRLFDAADRFIILAFRSATEVALYSAAYNAGTLFSTLLSPVQFILYPQMAALWNTDRQEELAFYVTNTLRFACSLLIPAVVGATLLAGPLLFLLVPNDSYLPAVSYFPVLALSFSVFSIGLLLSHLLVTVGRTRLLLVIDFTITAFNIILNIILVPTIGVWGAVCSTLACHICYSTAMYVVARRILSFEFPIRHFIRCLLCAAAMAAVLFFSQLHMAWPLAADIVLGGAIYVALLFALGGIRKEDLRLLRQIVWRTE